MAHSTRIERVRAREVFDSRGRPTVEVEIACAGSRPGRAIVPSGASTGRFETVELRDGDAGRLDGAGVVRAVENVRGPIAAAIGGCDAADQSAIDAVLCELDGTPDKSRLGANAVLGASLAAATAAAEALGVPLVEHLHELWRAIAPPDTRPFQEARAATPLEEYGYLLPLPMVNMISGGLHAGGNLDFQDFLILPVGAASYREALDWCVMVYRRLGERLNEAGYNGRLVGDEGGYGPELDSHEQALDMLVAAIEAARLRPGGDVAIVLDVAASHFHNDGCYVLHAEGDRPLRAGELIDLLADWVERYPILSIEDGVAEDDHAGWKALTDRLGSRVQLIGDDLFVTNPQRLAEGIAGGLANSVLVKPNQIGTLTETFDTLRLARQAGYRAVISARSGETEDTFIADLAVATAAGQIKIGSVARSERLAKYNQLLRLEERLGERAAWLGGRIFGRLFRTHPQTGGPNPP